VPVKKETARVFYKTLIGLSIVSGLLFILLRNALGYAPHSFTAALQKCFE